MCVTYITTKPNVSIEIARGNGTQKKKYRRSATTLLVSFCARLVMVFAHNAKNHRALLSTVICALYIKCVEIL